MSSKEFATCSYCSKIYKDPIILPCDDSICAHHLREPKCLNEKSIKCMECHLKFELAEGFNQFKPNKHLRQVPVQIWNVFDARREESKAKKIEAHPRLLQTAHNHFCAHRLTLNLMAVNNFAEQRRQIDLHRERERLKQLIDDISTQMIKETEEFGGRI